MTITKDIRGKNDNNKKEEEEQNESMSKETIRKIVDFAIAQNPLVYRRLADI
jgi:hypothetical protein